MHMCERLLTGVPETLGVYSVAAGQPVPCEKETHRGTWVGRMPEHACVMLICKTCEINYLVEIPVYSKLHIPPLGRLERESRRLSWKRSAIQLPRIVWSVCSVYTSRKNFHRPSVRHNGLAQRIHDSLWGCLSIDFVDNLVQRERHLINYRINCFNFSIRYRTYSCRSNWMKVNTISSFKQAVK